MNKQQLSRVKELQQWMENMNTDNPGHPHVEIINKVVTELLAINADLEQRLKYSVRKSRNRSKALRGLQTALLLAK